MMVKIGRCPSSSTGDRKGTVMLKGTHIATITRRVMSPLIRSTPITSSAMPAADTKRSSVNQQCQGTVAGR